MSEQYYIRVRGEVKGPTSHAQIVSMIRKKRLGRHHEVSTDGVNWTRVADVPELTGNWAPDMDRVTSASTAPSPEPAGTATEWFYAAGKTQIGPVTLEDLRTLLGSQAISGSTLVWKKGLEDWVPAGMIPELTDLCAARSGSPVVATSAVKSQSDSGTYCTNCGAQVSRKAVACPHCGVPPRSEKHFCYNCGIAVNENQVVCVGCGVGLTNASAGSGSNAANLSGYVRAEPFPRLGARFVDSAIAFVMIFAGVLGGAFVGAADSEEAAFGLAILGGVIGFVAFFGIQITMFTAGKTIGKHFLSLVVIDAETQRPCTFGKTFGREIITYVIALIPLIGNLVAIVDALFVFRQDRRRICDMLLSTDVVNTR